MLRFVTHGYPTDLAFGWQPILTYLGVPFQEDDEYESTRPQLQAPSLSKRQSEQQSERQKQFGRPARTGQTSTSLQMKLPSTVEDLPATGRLVTSSVNAGNPKCLWYSWSLDSPPAWHLKDYSDDEDDEDEDDQRLVLATINNQQ